tara:strand:- start:1470 stop:1694 length:225 start_codon:yes stop_codon:yes gene_type:complete
METNDAIDKVVEMAKLGLSFVEGDLNEAIEAVEKLRPKFQPKPAPGFGEAIKQTIGRNDVELARNKAESQPYTL